MDAGTARNHQQIAGRGNKSHTTALKLKAVALASELKSIRLAARQLEIDEKCIRNWKSQHALLVAALPNVRRLTAGKKRQAPYQEIEDKLYDEICELQHNSHRQQEEKRITRAWIIGRFEEMVKAQHAKRKEPQRKAYTSYSRWYDNFLRRKNVSLRARRKLSKKDADRMRRPGRAELWPRFAHFHCFIRKLAAAPQLHEERDVGKYALRAIGHFDQVPIAVGCEQQQPQLHSVVSAVACSGLFKKQQARHHTSSAGGYSRPNIVRSAAARSRDDADYMATFVPFICADGCTFIKPVIIFKESSSLIIGRSERYCYDKRVVVYANAKACVDDTILADVIARFRAETVGEPARLLVFDSSPHHVTQNVFEACEENNVDYAVVPVGCNQYLQPLDQGGIVNEWKVKFVQALDEAFCNTAGGFLRLTPRQRRIKLTSLIASTWFELLNSNEGKELIRQSFKKTGIAVKPDGSDDMLINIDGHAEYTIAAGLDGIISDNDDEKWIYDQHEYDDDDDRHDADVKDETEVVSANEEESSEPKEGGCDDDADASLALMHPVAFAELKQNDDADDDDDDMTDFDRLQIDADALL